MTTSRLIVSILESISTCDLFSQHSNREHETVAPIYYLTCTLRTGRLCEYSHIFLYYTSCDVTVQDLTQVLHIFIFLFFLSALSDLPKLFFFKSKVKVISGVTHFQLQSYQYCGCPQRYSDSRSVKPGVGNPKYWTKKQIYLEPQTFFLKPYHELNTC